MITFEYPLWLFLLIPLFWFVLHSPLGKKNSMGLLWSFKIWKHKSYHPGPAWPIVFVWISYLSFLLMMILLILILSRPQQILKERSYLTDGSAIIIVLDVSPSMAARDMGSETRFQLAQEAINRFIGSRENDMLGLISFGKDAAIRSPLTKDYRFLENTVKQTKILEHGDGTSIGTSLALAALHLKESPSKQKYVILITDGDNNSGEIHPDASIEILRTLGIKAFVIGLGRQGNNNVVVENPYTKEVLQGFVRNAYNEELLQRIAYQTGGQFFRAETLVTFESLFQIIDSQSPHERRFKLVPVVKEQTDLLFSIILICFAVHLFVRFIILREAL